MILKTNLVDNIGFGFSTIELGKEKGINFSPSK